MKTRESLNLFRRTRIWEDTDVALEDDATPLLISFARSGEPGLSACSDGPVRSGEAAGRLARHGSAGAGMAERSATAVAPPRRPTNHARLRGVNAGQRGTRFDRGSPLRANESSSLRHVLLERNIRVFPDARAAEEVQRLTRLQKVWSLSRVIRAGGRGVVIDKRDARAHTVAAA